MKIILLIALFFTLEGCQTPQPASVVETEEVVMTHYTLEKGPVIMHRKPFPWQTPVYVREFYSDGTEEKKLSYFSWDIDYDGIPDMIEELGEHDNETDTTADSTYRLVGGSLSAKDLGRDVSKDLKVKHDRQNNRKTAKRFEQRPSAASYQSNGSEN